jgi:DNA invertase Pin-like site-specific DNA recombinase
MKSQTVGYVRVSSASQNTARQLIGVDVDRMFTDIMPGNVMSRPQLEECLSYVREGDTLVVDSIDRLARNLRDLQDILDRLIKKGVNVRFIKENLTFTSSHDSMSMLMLQMMGAFSEFERTMIKIRQREGIEAAKKRGEHLGRPKTVTYDHIKKAKSMKADGLCISEISRNLKLSRPTIYSILRSP